MLGNDFRRWAVWPKVGDRFTAFFRLLIRVPCALLFGGLLLWPQFGLGDGLPNIVVILADDMGFGEVQHLNPDRGKIATPCLDAIARNGMVFTDGHSGSSVCTPTRYGLMTGRYAWRTRLQKGVLTGGESLVAKDRLTLASMLKKQGYHTAMIGKWHLGMLYDGKKNGQKGIPIGTKVTDGPIDRGGFDLFYGFHHARQMDILIKNNEVIERIDAIEMLPRLTQEAVKYIEGRKGKEQPFFMYVPWNAPHSPVVPTKEWEGKSGLNRHADFVMQTDDSFGQVMAALEANGFLENTIVICSSDNGTSGPTSKIEQLKDLGHFPSGYLRGSKADIWDGGHRVPFIVHWPKIIEPESRCEQIVCLTDVFATAAQLSGFEMTNDCGEDSISFLPLLKGQETLDGRKNVIHHSVSGRFAIRAGDWKLALCSGSGGWSAPKDRAATGNGNPKWQLYNLKQDLGEQNNLYEKHSEKAEELMELLKTQVTNGRSTNGEPLANDVDVEIESSEKKNGSKKNRKTPK
ncbi:arylsulfatase [bacterium]|nr:arylsulfatase [bacterium]